MYLGDAIVVSEFDGVERHVQSGGGHCLSLSPQEGDRESQEKPELASQLESTS